MSDVIPLDTPCHPQTLAHMTITNFNYEGSYLPGVICNIVVKADLGRWTPLGNRAEMPWIPVHQNWQTKLLLLMDPPSESSIDALNTTTPNLADEPTLADGPISPLLLTSSGQEDGNFTLLLTIQWSRMADISNLLCGRWTPQWMKIDAFNTATPTLLQRTYFGRWTPTFATDI